MKTTIFKLTITTFALGIAIAACKSSEEKKDDSVQKETEQVKPALSPIHDEGIEDYDSFRSESEEKIRVNEGLIAQLKDNAKKVKKEAKSEYERAVSDLEKSNQEMREKLRTYKKEGKEEWQSFKHEFNHDMDELGKALKNLTENNIE